MFTKYQRGIRPSTGPVLERSALSTLLVEKWHQVMDIWRFADLERDRLRKQSKYILVGEPFSGKLLGMSLERRRLFSGKRIETEPFKSGSQHRKRFTPD